MKNNYLKESILFWLAIFLTVSLKAQTIAWQPKHQLGDDVPSRFGAGMTSLNGKLYITGGYDAGGSGHVHDFVEYDPVTGAVRNLELPSTSNPTSNILVTVNGKIYHYIAPFFLEYDFATNTWLPKAWNTTATTTNEGAAFVIGNEVYLISENNNIVNAYNVVTNSWTAKANFPGTPRRAAVAFELDGKGYFGGGNSNSSNACYSSDGGCFHQDFYEYNPATNTWTAKANFPKPIKNAVGYGHNSRGYVGLGNVSPSAGFNYGATATEWLEYNPATNTWATKAPAPAAPVAAAITKINNDLYIFGGRGINGTVNTVSHNYNSLLKYNVPGNTWSVMETQMGGNRVNGAGFYTNNKIYYGSGHDGQPLADFWEYDLTANSWTPKAPFPTFFAQRTAVSVNGKGYFIGGYYKDSGAYTDALLEYDPATNIWTSKAPFPGGVRGNIAAFTLNGKIYAGLGFNGTSTNKSDFYMYDPATNAWVAKANVPLFNINSAQNTSAFSIGNTGYILQHSDSQGQGSKLYAYDPGTNTWSVKASQPLINDQPGVNQSFVLNGKAYVFSGNKIYEYDPATNTWRTAGTASFPRTHGFIVGTPNEGFMGFGVGNLNSSNWKVMNDWWRMCMGTSSTLTVSNCESYTLNGQTYTSSGTYTQTRLNTAGCDSIITLNLTIRSKPVAPTPPATRTYCQNETATALTATGTALLWYPTATGGTGSASAPVPSTATAGTTNYYVSQTVNGCESNRSTVTVIVNATPNPPTVTATQNYCQFDLAPTLTATCTTLKWYTVATGGTGVTAAPTINTNTPTTVTHYVSQTVNGCESARSAIAVTVNAKPAAPTVTAASFCQGSATTPLTATGTGLLWYTTSSGGTGSATAPTPVTTSGGTTTYYVSQTVNGCESNRSALNVSVAGAPTAPAVTSTQNYCQNATAPALTASGSGLKWYTVATGGTGSTTAPVPTTTAAGTTTYYVSQTVNNCESPRASIAVTITAKPADPTVVATTSLCQAATASALTATGTGLKWYTTATGGTGTTTAPTPSTTTAGTTNYYVSQTVNGCESDRALMVVQVTAAPATPTISQNGGTLTSSSATGNQWYLNGTAIPGATGQIFVTTANGNYTLQVTANGCPSALSAVRNVTNTGIGDALAGMSVEVYPNPAKGSFNVKLNGYQKDATVVLYNMAGQQIASEKVSADGQSKTIDIKGLAAGTYLLKVTFEKGIQVSRLMVQ